MDIILYNPISRNGKNNRLVLRLARKLEKNGKSVEIKSLLEISNIANYLNSVNKRARFIIVGGDGTLNHLANAIKDIKIEQDIFLYRAGTGNDFARSIKTRKRLFSIKEYLYNLPTIEFNEKEYCFLNGVGLGVDGYVGHLVNEAAIKKNKGNYLAQALTAFKTFEPVGSTVIIDGVSRTYDKTWIVAVMNSKYFGGGMKIAPHANRSDNKLDVVVVKRVSRFKLFLIFPLIYIGWHRFFKKYVEIHKASDVTITFDRPNYMQIDGDTFDGISEIKVKTRTSN